MTFYIASRLENAEMVKRVAAALTAAGHTHTYDWTVHGSVQNEGQERITEVAEAEKIGVLQAEVVIVILPGGRGTHAELGIALGAGNKKIIACAETEEYFMFDERTCAFYWDRRITRVAGEIDVWLRVIYHQIAEIEAKRSAKREFLKVLEPIILKADRTIAGLNLSESGNVVEILYNDGHGPQKVNILGNSPLGLINSITRACLDKEGHYWAVAFEGTV